MPILRDPHRRPAIIFALVGAATGAATAAACIELPLGDFGALSIGGYCFGVLPIIGSHCGGVDAALYLFPGLFFGIVFGPLLRRCGRLSRSTGVTFAAVAIIANAAAVFLFVLLLHPIDDVLPFDILTLDVAIAGVPAGGVGAGLLAAMLDRGGRPLLPLLVGAGLGLLVALPVMFDEGGVLAFYILWQAGFAAALGEAGQPAS